ncbi:hypothetical protein EDC01DRAFT_646412 [Geopyxis carbonaria]|nr:hypothetical protein EDC01DRAFT_646412 [Geopyxis carbonaria]
MAKSARASRTKANNSALREKVHRPVEDARLQRLSEKLLETARSNIGYYSHHTIIGLC